MPARHLRVLLVDDEPDILLLLQALLSMRGWEIIGKASGGEDAFRIADQIVPDVAIVDFMMPIMNGLQVADRLKALHPSCRIVLFTAYEVARPESAEHVLQKTDLRGLQDLLDSYAQELGVD